MPRPKPRWDYRPEFTDLRRPGSVFWQRIIEIVEVDDSETLAAFCEELSHLILWYRQRSEHKRKRLPTSADLRQTAKVLAEEAGRLGGVLIGGAGGLDLHIRKVLRFGDDPSPRKLGLYLRHIAAACRKIESWEDRDLQVLEGMGDYCHESPRNCLAVDLARLFKAVLDQEPTKTCNPETEALGVFAEVLKACIEQENEYPLPISKLKHYVTYGIDNM